MHRVIPLLLLVFTYLALSENVAFPNLVFGTIIATGILVLLRPRRRAVRWARMPKAFLSLVIYILSLIRDVIRSGIQIVRIVLHPDLPIRSGIVAIPPECDSEVGRALGAHAISLPPGELLIEMDTDGTMYIHSLDVGETERQALSSQKIRRYLLQNIFD